jgi:acid phosphatase type 7
MKKFTLLILVQIFTLLFAFGQNNPVKICSASDLHFMDPSLLKSNGVAFQTYLAQDRKLIAESKAITAELVKQIKQEKPDIFIISGDLTKDGEKISHITLAKYLDSIEMNGVTKVYVVPGNHDVNNVHAYSYDGASKTRVDSISPADFKSIYNNFGYAEAASTDPNSLSYLAKPQSKLWILGIDVCEYDSNMVKHEPVTAGRFKPETYKWVLARLAEAKTAGATVIGIMHHGITEHYTGQSIAFPEYVVAGWDTISKNLANAGLKIMFTGHYHANDITKVTGSGSNFLYDIETGSTVTWPCPYRVMTLNSNNYFDVVTRTINHIDYDTNGKSFQDYAKDYLNTGLSGIVKYTLINKPYSLDDATASALVPHVVNAYAAHYAGNESIPAAESAFISYLTSKGQTTFSTMLTNLWTDLAPSDNNVTLNLGTGAAQTKQTLQFVLTSDPHYGITRPRFQKASNVNATVVNGAMIAKMNTLPSLSLPKDEGVNAGNVIGGIDYVINTGDISNRMEVSSKVQSAALSWSQFKTDYIDNLSLKNNKGEKTKLLVIPGNHDVSNAIGFYKAMSPLKDSTAMVNVYNLMMSQPISDGNYNYTNGKVHFSKNIGGIHMMFVNIWPDSSERVWMESDLASVSPTTPVFIFTHDQPAVESKHFTNPNGLHTINSTDQFENNLLEIFKDGKATSVAATIEMKGFASFIKAHSNIIGYFHGNDHQNKFYVYNGPDNNIVLNTFDSDSPMKGIVSGTSASNGKGDETKLSFNLVSIDSISKTLTIRQCLWNTDTVNTSTPVAFGESKTISLVVDTTIIKANSLVESNYTVPSWTSYLRTYKAVKTNPTTEAIAALATSIKNLVSKNNPYNVGMTINGDPTTRMGFTWFSNLGTNGGMVKIVTGKASDTTAFAKPLFTVNATSDTAKNLNYNVSANGLLSLAGIADNTKKTYLSNKATVSGLSANTTYSFMVGKPGAWSSVGTFTTAKATKEPFSFIYTTDPQAQTDDMFNVSQKTTHAANIAYPNANFWLSCGDLVESSGASNAEWEYEQFFSTQQDIWYKKPFAPVMGNHDITTNKNFTYHFNTNNPSFDKKMAGVPGSVYSFVYGDALFLALDYENYSTAGYLDSLANWMRKEVASHPEVKWRIAFYHKTMFTGSGSHQSDADGWLVRNKMAPVFDELKIDLALQGHDHVYEVIGPVKNKKLVNNAISNQSIVTRTVRDNVSGRLGGTFDVTNGTLYFLNNSAGKKKYEPRDSMAMDKAKADTLLKNGQNYFSLFTGRFGQTGEPTFSNIIVSTDSINVSTYTVNDQGVPSLFDSYKVVKTVHVGSVNVSSKNIDITIGKKAYLTATVNPVSATNKNIIWSSSNTAIAIVKNGEISAIGLGVAYVVVKSVDGAKSDSCKVTVKPVYVNEIIVRPLHEINGIYVDKGSLQLIAEIKPNNATIKKVNWSVNDTLLATVNAYGLVTAKRNGWATITATATDGSNIKGSIAVWIKNQKILVSGITVITENNTDSITIKHGKLEMQAIVTPADASCKAVRWSIDDKSLANITEDGVLIAHNDGKVEVTATAKDGSKVEGSATIVITGQNCNIPGFILWPNPSNGYIVIKVKDFRGPLNYSIILKSGIVVMSGKIYSNEKTINLSSLHKGHYVFVLQNAGSQAFDIN